METEEERKARLENVATTKLFSLAGRRKKIKTGEDVATTQLMLAMTKGVVNVGIVLFLKPILKSWQLCLLFKLDVHRHPLLKEI